MNALEATPFVVLLDVHGQAVWVSRGESGVPQARLIGTTIWDWTIPEDRRRAQQAWADCQLNRQAHTLVVTVDVGGGNLVQQCVSLEHTGGDTRPVIVKSHAIDPRFFLLTARQRDVLRFLSLGYSRKQAARALGVKGVTIDAHCAQICERLGLANSTELTIFAVLHGHDF